MGILYAVNGDGELAIKVAGQGDDKALYVANFENGVSGNIHLGTLIFRWWFLTDHYGATNVGNKSGIGIGEGLGTVLDAFWKMTYGVPRHPGGDPLLLDLDGDGLELNAQVKGRSTLFDTDGDGFLEPTGWVRGDDGILVRDLNGDGVINDASELFGTTTDDGFTVLAAEDSNADGVIDANDAIYADLKVWQDANEDGITDPGELMTLQEAGIASISLTTTTPPAGEEDNAGNFVSAVSTFTRSDGTTSTISNVYFNTDEFNTVHAGGTTNQLPLDGVLSELKGTGTLTDLRYAMSQDPALQTLVEQVMPTLTSHRLDDLRALVEPVLVAWADPVERPHDVVYLKVERDSELTLTAVDAFYFDDGAGYDYYRLVGSNAGVPDGQGGELQLDRDGVEQFIADPANNSADSYWITVDGNLLDFGEHMLGQEISIDLERPEGGGQTTLDLAGDVLRMVDLEVVRLAMQGPLQSSFDGIAYNPVDNTFVPTTERELIPFFEAIYAGAPADAAGTEAYLTDWTSLIFAMLPDYHRAGGSHLEVSVDFVFSQIIAAYKSVGLPIDIKTAADLWYVPQDVIVTGGPGTLERTETLGAESTFYYLNAGDQIAVDGSGRDVYFVGSDFGHDTISDIELYLQSRQLDDVVRFATYDSTDVTATRDGVDLVIGVNGTDNDLRITGQFTGKLSSLNGGQFGDEYGVAEIIFADGVVWDQYDIARAVSHPLAGDETITGTETVDYLDGGTGNDLLIGGRDTDSYYFELGYGNDTIRENPSNSGVRGLDYLIFGPGIASEDLILSADGPSLDLTIGFTGTSDTITIENQLWGDQTGPLGVLWRDRIEQFLFDDGSTMNWTDVLQQVVRGAATDGDDHIWGYHTRDQIEGGAGNDYLSGRDDGDTYIYNPGDGNDTIEDNQDDIFTTTDDVLRLGDGITAAGTTFFYAPGTYDVSIKVDDGSVITLANQLQGQNTWVFGVVWRDRIERIEFSDGTTVTWDDIMRDVVELAANCG